MQSLRQHILFPLFCISQNRTEIILLKHERWNCISFELPQSGPWEFCSSQPSSQQHCEVSQICNHSANIYLGLWRGFNWLPFTQPHRKCSSAFPLSAYSLQGWAGKSKEPQAVLFFFLDSALQTQILLHSFLVKYGPISEQCRAPWPC